MGQDRQYSDEQREFALKTVQEFKERWEQLEEENMRQDILTKVERSEMDKVYKENHDVQDQLKIEKRVEEAIAVITPKDTGKEEAEPVPEDDKIMVTLKAKFQHTTRTFYAPELAQQHKAKLDKL